MYFQISSVFPCSRLNFPKTGKFPCTWQHWTVAARCRPAPFIQVEKPEAPFVVHSSLLCGGHSIQCVVVPLSFGVVVHRTVIGVLSTNIVSLSCGSCWLQCVAVGSLWKMGEYDTMYHAAFIQLSSRSVYCRTTVVWLSSDFRVTVVCRGIRRLSWKKCKSFPVVVLSSLIVLCGTRA